MAIKIELTHDDCARVFRSKGEAMEVISPPRKDADGNERSKPPIAFLAMAALLQAAGMFDTVMQMAKQSHLTRYKADGEEFTVAESEAHDAECAALNPPVSRRVQ